MYSMCFQRRRNAHMDGSHTKAEPSLACGITAHLHRRPGKAWVTCRRSHPPQPGQDLEEVAGHVIEHERNDFLPVSSPTLE